jgi:hypothetical protein
MTDTTQELPESLDYNEANIGKREPKFIKDGIYKGVYKFQKVGVYKTGSIYIEGKWVLIGEDGEPTKFSVRDRRVLPLSNPSVPGMKEPNTTNIWRSFLLALGDAKVDQIPRKSKDGGYELNGQSISKDEVKAYYNNSEKQVKERCKELYRQARTGQPVDLDDCIAYMRVVRGEDFKTNTASDWPEVDGVFGELRDGQEVILSNFLANDAELTAAKNAWEARQEAKLARKS